MQRPVAGTGGYLPAKVLTNAEMATRIDTSDQWVRARTGICERRIAAAIQRDEPRPAAEPEPRRHTIGFQVKSGEPAKPKGRSK